MVSQCPGHVLGLVPALPCPVPHRRSGDLVEEAFRWRVADVEQVELAPGVSITARRPSGGRPVASWSRPRSLGATPAIAGELGCNALACPAPSPHRLP